MAALRFSRTDYPLPVTLWSVNTGDFNGDGHADLVTANIDSNGVSVLLGNGDGTFGAAGTLATGAGPSSIAIADLNGDGRLDLVTSNVNSNNVSVLLGNGLGGFGNATYFSTGTNPRSVVLGDLNGDGKLDLVTSNQSSSVSVLLGDGDGTFGAATNITVGAGIHYALALSDFNVDGKLDLAVAGSDTNDLSVLLGNGDGTFGAAAAYAVGTSPYSIAVGDFNGDGQQDLATSTGGTVSVLLGAGDGTFGAATQFDGAGVVKAADVNGDGKLDLVTSSASVLLGNGDGTFADAINFAAGSQPSSVAVGDLGGTSLPDLVVVNYNAQPPFGRGSIAVLLNTTDAPTITSNDGGDTAAISIVENTTAVTTVTASDPDAGQTLSYSISGGADAGKFSINATTGALVFITAPNFEALSDSDGNNVYDVTVQASDGNGGTDTQAIAVTVQNANEAPTITSNDTELVALYSFDETDGSIAHDQQGEHDGTIIGATFVSGVSGNALQFNGSSDYISVPDSSEFTLGSSDFTIEFWANFNSASGAPIGHDEGGGTTNKWILNFSGGNINFHVNTSIGQNFNVAAPFEPTTGQWYAFALTKSGSTYRFYVDGQLVGSADQTLAIPDVDAPLTIGQAEGAFYFDGQLDGVAIHHRALSPAEVGAISIAENSTAVTTVMATDPDAGQTLSYSISGGADASKFSINPTSGALTFLAPPNFEAPSDVGGNNVYNVIVQVSDGNGGTDVQAIAVTVTDESENAAPSITSNDGGDTAAVSIAENTTAVTTVVAADPDAGQTLTYSLAGGADAGKFSINPTSGALRFINAPDFENQTDVGTNNVYDVIVQVADGNSGTDTQAIAVTVTNVAGLTKTSNDKTIPGTIEPDQLTGLAGANTLQGLGGNDVLVGGGGNDILQGDDGNDFLDGGSGKDTMAGGAGNDTYIVDNSGDVVTENNGGGTDTVLSSISFTLGANLENLTLTGAGKIDGSGNTLSNNVTGNSGNNILFGLAGNDLLNGGAGNDYLVGGPGVDVLTGGQGFDAFVFNALADSTPAGFDIVQDFVHGVDKIDVVGIDANTAKNGNQTFVFAGQNSSVVGNSVTWYESGGNTFVQADVNGNTTADVLIELVGTNLNLISSDFLL